MHQISELGSVFCWERELEVIGEDGNERKVSPKGCKKCHNRLLEGRKSVFPNNNKISERELEVIGEGGRERKVSQKKVAKKLRTKCCQKKLSKSVQKNLFREEVGGWKGEPTVRSRWLQFWIPIYFTNLSQLLSQSSCNSILQLKMHLKPLHLGYETKRWDLYRSNIRLRNSQIVLELNFSFLPHAQPPVEK